MIVNLIQEHEQEWRQRQFITPKVFSYYEYSEDTGKRKLRYLAEYNQFFYFSDFSRAEVRQVKIGFIHSTEALGFVQQKHKTNYLFPGTPEAFLNQHTGVKLLEVIQPTGVIIRYIKKDEEIEKRYSHECFHGSKTNPSPFFATIKELEIEINKKGIKGFENLSNSQLIYNSDLIKCRYILNKLQSGVYTSLDELKLFFGCLQFVEKGQLPYFWKQFNYPGVFQVVFAHERPEHFKDSYDYIYIGHSASVLKKVYELLFKLKGNEIITAEIKKNDNLWIAIKPVDIEYLRQYEGNLIRGYTKIAKDKSLNYLIKNKEYLLGC